MPGTIFLGIGIEEALNEESTVGSWPKVAEISEPLNEAAEEAIDRAGQNGDGLITDPKTWKQYKAEFRTGITIVNVHSGQRISVKACKKRSRGRRKRGAFEPEFQPEP
jgi:hypothetical protein